MAVSPLGAVGVVSGMAGAESSVEAPPVGVVCELTMDAEMGDGGAIRWMRARPK